MGVTDMVKGWIFKIALKKGIVSAAKLIVAFAVTHGIKTVITFKGITVDLQSEAAMIVAINSGLTILRNFLKTKYPQKFGWL